MDVSPTCDIHVRGDYGRSLGASSQTATPGQGGVRQCRAKKKLDMRNFITVVTNVCQLDIIKLSALSQTNLI